MPGSVIVSTARTPIGKLSGALASLPATELGGHAIKAALARAGIAGDQVDYVIMGQVLQAGAGQMPARQAAVAGGVPMSVPSMRMVPESIVSRPLKQLRSVVFPQPDGPMIATISPAGTMSVTPRSARTSVSLPWL